MHIPFLMLAALCLAVVCAAAQSNQPEGEPASSNVRDAQYPRVLTDLRVVFRVNAPEAKSVAFDLGKSYPAVKDKDGNWSVTTDPQVPGFHYYFLVIDGVRVCDPNSETYFGWGKQASGIEIPEKGVDYYSVKNVPHGDVRQRWYFSKTTGDFRRAFIYCPPGYDRNTSERYPVLYLQHGAGEDERGWSNQGRLSMIMDNLIAEGKAKPMLIVMEKGYAKKPGVPELSLFSEPRPDISKVFEAFEEVIVHDLISMVDAEYRTKADREHRALAGLSMGGFQAFSIGLKHTDLCSVIGGFSGAGGGFDGKPFDIKTINGGAMADVAAFNKKMKFLWLGIGTAEPAGMVQSVSSYYKGLKAAGINVKYYESPGTDHEWLTWRRCLHEFAPLLFR